jgi:hypothetical protein
LFRTWLKFTEPIAVIINGGEHSVLVTGGWMNESITTHYPAGVLGVVIRDPEFAGAFSRFEVDGDQWTNHGGNFGQGYYTLWARPYGATLTNAPNHDDPEPSVGIYTPDANHPQHWWQGFTWIRRDNQSTTSVASPDWAFTDLGTLLTAP